MIEIRKITEKDKYHRDTAIKYVVQLGELKSYLTEKALIELQIKLNTFAIQNVSTPFCKCVDATSYYTRVMNCRICNNCGEEVNEC